MPPSTPAKFRALGIQHEYLKSGDRQRRLKWTCLLAVVAVLGIALVWAGFSGQEPLLVSYSPGELSHVHAAWERQCSACHADFEPIRDDAWASEWKSASLHPHAEVLPWSRDADLRCLTCHAGPPHHPTQNEADVGNCASCHREHGGRSATLVKLDDGHCTRCHEDLKHRSPETPDVTEFSRPLATHIASFQPSDGHPPFRSLDDPGNPSRKLDPGRLKFTHSRHLAPGLLLPGDKCGKPITMQRIAEHDKPRYAQFAADRTGILTLDCEACHQTGREAIKDQRSELGKVAGGEYMLPISFERDCRACHKLLFPLEGQNETPNSVTMSTVPHGLAPAEIRDVVRGAAARTLVARGLDLTSAPPPIEVQTPGEEASVTTKDLKALITRAEENLEVHTCGQCHHFQRKGVDSDNQDGVVLMSAVEPVGIPAVWLRHARFDHHAHRKWACIECHAVPREHDPCHEHKNVLIPNQAKCLECHSPNAVKDPAGYACVECHTYHGGARDAKESATTSTPAPEASTTNP